MADKNVPLDPFDPFALKPEEEEFLMAIERLIVSWPLYRPYHFNHDFLNSSSEVEHELLFPSVISMQWPKCVHRQPWELKSGSVDLGNMYQLNLPRFHEVCFACKACECRQHLWLRIKAGKTGGSILKTGQYPPLAVDPPPLVSAGMDKTDLRLYRQALICRNSNFGIAAVAYLRRIVENRTNFLIDLIAARIESEDPNSAALAKVDEIKKDRRFSEKINCAAELLPNSVRIGGQNPISLLHDLTSEALHGLSDEESVDVFDRCQLAFEHVIKRLKADQDEDQQFKDAMKKLMEKAARNS
jgi:hypothetical protein